MVCCSRIGESGNKLRQKLSLMTEACVWSAVDWGEQQQAPTETESHD